MKSSTGKQLLSLLLALVMVLALAPVALMADTGDSSGTGSSASGSESEGETGGESGSGAGSGADTDPGTGVQDTLRFNLSQGVNTIDPSRGLLLAQEGKAPDIRVSITAQDSAATKRHEDDRITWESSDPATVEPHRIPDQNTGIETGRTFYVQAKKPGKATITGTVTDPDGRPTGAANDKISFEVTVSGILPNASTITVKENETHAFFEETSPGSDPFGVVYYGNASDGLASISSDRRNVVIATGTGVSRDKLTIDAVAAGTAIVTISAGIYSAKITVDVETNEAQVIQARASLTNPLKFSALEDQIRAQCAEMITAEGDKTLTSLTGLSVSTSEGTIYLGYKSPDDTGAGAGSGLTYYASNQARGPYIKDLVFVPNPSFTGDKATITYTGKAANGRIFKGRIEVTIEENHTNVILETRSDVPLKLKAEDFTTVCQQQTGSALSYVIFTLPPASEGVLYRDYKNALDYASRVSASEQYDRKGLNTITFVPAEGFVGTVTVSYAGYSVTGTRYNGELTINVKRSLDDGIQYQDYGSGEITFSGNDFDAYCVDMTGARMSTVSFTLPPESQGILYYRWSSNSQRYPVASGNSFSQTQLGYVTFVAANGFDGVVRIPFTGTNWYGAEFSGTAELHIQAGNIQNGDIRYTCQPGQSAKLVVSDFASLCQAVTGQRLYYVTFQALPDFTQGSLFYNRTSSGVIGTRVTTASKYFNSATPYLNNVSFWATDKFRSVEIPFTLAAVNGETFTGLMVISNGEGVGNGRAGSVTYTTSGQQPLTLNASDFDAACRQATNSALNYLKLTLPGSAQGILYYDYREGDTPKAFDPNTMLYCTGGTSINEVTFVPAKNFSGTAFMYFTATAINGATYQGTLEITVRAGAAYGSIVRYSTGGAPVHFLSYDFSAASGIGQPSGIRLTGLPSASQGRVYYQYISPTQYSWLGNTTSTYSVTGDPSVSNLTFIPKAGYQGVVRIPYAMTASDGTTSTGTIEITVVPPDKSEFFDDLTDFPAQTKAAVDYMASQGVVNGMSYRTYAPGQSIRRGDFCLMVSRAFQFKVGGTGQSFNDVPIGHYYAQAIQEMYALGVVNGVGGGRFQPEATITRQDAAVMVCRALEKAGLPLPDGSDQATLAGYTDRNQVDGYAQAALSSLVRAGFFPSSGNKLEPKAPITRADMALLLHRAMTNFS